MSFYKQNISAFIQILKQHSNLFLKHTTALNDLLENLPEDAEQISRAISVWCEERPEILKIQTDTIQSLSDSSETLTRGFGGSPPPPPDPAPNPAEKKKLRKELINAIRRFTSPSQSQDKSDEYTKKKSD